MWDVQVKNVGCANNERTVLTEIVTGAKEYIRQIPGG